MVMENKTQPGALGGILCFRDESVGKLLSSCSDCGPGAAQEQYKSCSISSLPHPLLSCTQSHWEQGKSEALYSSFIHSHHCASMEFFSTKLSLLSIPDSGFAFYGRGKGTKAVT